MPFTTINDPSKYFQTAIWTGDGNDDRSITFDGNSDMQPDMVWTKRRPTSSSHGLRDSTRGATVELFPDSSDDELAVSDRFQAFESDGFQVGTNADINGTSNNTYVAWAWKANGGTTTTNDASATGVGTIDSVYQANTTAGFSIVTHTGSGSAGNIAHGLGVAPEWILTKNRSQDSTSWANYHASVGKEYYLELDTSDPQETASSVWGDTTPSSTTFRVGGANTKNNSSSDNFVSYCFAPIQGYSKFGSYVGSGENNGIFVFTGFQPAFIMIKRTDSSTNGNWWIHDTKRHTSFNPSSRTIKADTSAAEVNSSDQYLDILSNGFKTRNGNNSQNGSTNSYVYMAFAEKPFVTSSGVPTTAR